ncbi:hypothetical protein [Fodinicola feengrottensis]|uniref:hypothetical protein n=1 Tax=Fodinicola feengrottensis TaxID=435914 RepID=UPI0013D74877|nr:hypothetical protein [Fodinicola feengrottensis]
MPTPTFNAVVITAASDPLTPVVARSSSRSETSGISGKVVTYAAGRQRSVSHVGTTHQFVMTLRDVSDLPVTLPAPGTGTVVPLQLLQEARGWACGS